MDYYREDKQYRGKLAPPYLEKGMLLGVKRTFRVEKMVGGGGFGQIYRALDLDSKMVVAVKVEPKSSESGRLILELKILLLLGKSIHTPSVYYSGELGPYNFIVMQLLGRNIGDMRKYRRTRSFSPITTSRVGVQCIDCMREFHTLGYIHRDMKPSNICVGIGEHKRVLYIVDFGMARQIRMEDGTFRPERKYASFRGTTRYVSLAAHERKEQGFVDDLWSLFFTLVELVEGLPWKNVADQDEVYMAKKLMLKSFQARKMNRTFEIFPKILEKIMRTELPDYDRLNNILKTSCSNYSDDSEFEWDEDDYSDSF